MTRHECEELILKRLEEIVEIYKEYDKNGKYLSMCFIEKPEQRYLTVDNADCKKKINASKFCENGNEEIIRTDEIFEKI